MSYKFVNKDESVLLNVSLRMRVVSALKILLAIFLYAEEMSLKSYLFLILNVFFYLIREAAKKIFF